MAIYLIESIPTKNNKTHYRLFDIQDYHNTCAETDDVNVCLDWYSLYGTDEDHIYEKKEMELYFWYNGITKGNFILFQTDTGNWLYVINNYNTDEKLQSTLRKGKKANVIKEIKDIIREKYNGDDSTIS